jgi:hypothetical protein
MVKSNVIPQAMPKVAIYSLLYDLSVVIGLAANNRHVMRHLIPQGLWQSGWGGVNVVGGGLVLAYFLFELSPCFNHGVDGKDAE